MALRGEVVYFVGLRCLEGIRRPGIAVIIEGEGGPFMVIDVGANPQPKPIHLLHYGMMGSAYYKHAYNVPKPRVGLLNIGTEDKKGNILTKEASRLLTEAVESLDGLAEEFADSKAATLEIGKLQRRYGKILADRGPKAR